MPANQIEILVQELRMKTLQRALHTAGQAATNTSTPGSYKHSARQAATYTAHTRQLHTQRTSGSYIHSARQAATYTAHVRQLHTQRKPGSYIHSAHQAATHTLPLLTATLVWLTH